VYTTQIVYNVLTLRFRRKSDFHPKKDLDDESIGKTDRFLLSMTHRRRKSEGHIEPNSYQVCSYFTFICLFNTL